MTNPLETDSFGRKPPLVKAAGDQWHDMESNVVRVFDGQEWVPRCEWVARQFHESYERLAPSFDYRTREASAVPWDQVPDNNRRLMISVVEDLARRGVIR